jgi:uncharacterized membrane protein YhaH (DUF805 family)
MHLLKLFFSFRGRASRAGYWLVSLTWLVLAFVLDYLWSATGASEVAVGTNHLVDAAFVLLILPPLVSCIAIGVTRLHDRNKSAGWVLLFYLCPPVVQTIASLNDLDSALMVWLMVLSGAITIWGLIELGCLRGTIGPNRYGPDPLSGMTDLPRQDDVAIGRF